MEDDEETQPISAEVERTRAETASLPPVQAIERAVADLWTRPLRVGDDHVVFYDHDVQPARVRYADGEYLIAWAIEDEAGEAAWAESGHRFDNAREAAFYAFQGRVRAGQL